MSRRGSRFQPCLVQSNETNLEAICGDLRAFTGASYDDLDIWHELVLFADWRAIRVPTRQGRPVVDFREWFLSDGLGKRVADGSKRPLPGMKSSEQRGDEKKRSSLC